MTVFTKMSAIGTVVALAMALVSAQTHASHQITNGEITATVYLPDAKQGFQRIAELSLPHVQQHTIGAPRQYGTHHEDYPPHTFRLLPILLNNHSVFRPGYDSGSLFLRPANLQPSAAYNGRNAVAGAPSSIPSLLL